MLSKDTKVQTFQNMFKMRWQNTVSGFQNTVGVDCDPRLEGQVGNKIHKFLNARLRSLHFIF